MTVLIEDTARNNLALWTVNAFVRGIVDGVIISPFTTPLTATSYKQSAARIVERFQEAECPVWVDPTTHALQMAGVGDFRYYDEWGFWSGVRGALNSEADRRDHIRRVFDAQYRLGVPRLAPTILLHNPQSQTSLEALEMAQLAVDEDPNTVLAIAGDTHFWSSGDDLDAHIGALAQLAPEMWFISTARVASVVPVPANATEIAGLCRTVRSLSAESSVHISHGDLAGLPAVAAGASSVGSGWDLRQRVLAYSDFQPRSDLLGGGQWYKRPTLEILLGNLSTSEFALLQAQNSDLAARLLPGVLAPGPEEAFTHHVSVLRRVITDLAGREAGDAYLRLSDLYRIAREEWPSASLQAGAQVAARGWIEPFAEGLRIYGHAEGW